MESNGSKRNISLQIELPFGEKILKKHLSLFSDKIDSDSLYISRQEFLRLLEINVNK
ncbi:hypothetical protein [uncultured Aquimarina sp.]|uniref:hypothetical protein n=1 Tax=uncultured Aquimarina sp. TaxID=575652 RepID=UPI00262A9796|nr:hypothetical protein [uncultured Aquimarina sp.]